MAIVQNPITGRSSGKFATAVFSKQFGKNTMRSKPIEVANPQTTKQMTQRMKFSMLIVVARMLLTFLRIGFKQYATAMSAFNAFVKENISLIIAGVYPYFTIDYTKLIVAKGTLTGLLTPIAAAQAGHEIKISWTDNTGSGDALATDNALLVIINSTKSEVMTSTVDAQRSTEEKVFVCPASWVGDTVECYASASDVDVTKIADSEYCNNVVVLA